MDNWHPSEASCWSQAAVSLQLTPAASKPALLSRVSTPDGGSLCPALGGGGGPGVSCTAALPHHILSLYSAAPLCSSACVALRWQESMRAQACCQPVQQPLPQRAGCGHRAGEQTHVSTLAAHLLHLAAGS